MKWDTEFIIDRIGHVIATQSNPSDEREVSIRTTHGKFVYLNREQVVGLIGNLVTLLADLEE